MITETTPNLSLSIPTRTGTKGSLDALFNENLRIIDNAIGLMSGSGYSVRISSSNGTDIPINRSENNKNTTVLKLTAKIFSSVGDITSQVSEDRFIWRRKTFGKPSNWADDLAWNLYYNQNRSKSINITRNEVNIKATFYCDLEGVL